MIDLESLKKEEHYDIPEGYFDQLPNQVMTAIRKKRNRTRKTWIAAAAAVMLAIVTTTLVINFTNEVNAPANMQVTEISEEEQLEDQMINYYSDELAQMDYYNY